MLYDLSSVAAFLTGAQIQGKQVHQDPVLSCDRWVELQNLGLQLGI